MEVIKNALATIVYTLLISVAMVYRYGFFEKRSKFALL